MRNFSPKREAKQRSYLRMLKEKPCDGRCQGCGGRVPLTPSHLVPRSYDIEMLDMPENVHWHCHSCHRLCEAGKYRELQDGAEIVAFLREHKPEYLALKELKNGSYDDTAD